MIEHNELRRCICGGKAKYVETSELCGDIIIHNVHVKCTRCSNMTIPIPYAFSTDAKSLATGEWNKRGLIK